MGKDANYIAAFHAARRSRASVNSVQDRVTLGVHHRRTSSGQKIKGNLGVGFSAMVIGKGGVATGSAAIAIICLRLLGAVRVDAAFAFFLFVHLFHTRPTRRSAVRSAASQCSRGLSI